MSPLESLAPDQRAVVQLVLQQGRSYADLAGLLGIDEAAVRRRAYRGVAALAAGHALPEDDQEEIADFLLGQQSVSEREDTRRFLSDSATARAWARAVATELESAAPGQVPEIPGDDAVEAPAPATAVREPLDEPTIESSAEDVMGESGRDVEEPAAGAAATDDWLEDDEDFAPATTRRKREPEPGKRARPARPKPADKPAGDLPAVDPSEFAPPPSSDRGRSSDAPRSSKLGGALLIGALALIIAAVVIVLVNRGDDEDPATSDEPAATQTSTAPQEQAQVLAQINMRGQGKAIGVAQVFLQGDNPAFQLLAQNVPANRPREAYGIWLYSSPSKAVRLGFTPVVTEDGNLRVGNNLPPEFVDYRQVVVSRERTDDAKRPGPIILRGNIPRNLGG